MPLKLDLNEIGIPVCVVDVGCDERLRIQGINAATARETGFESDRIVGLAFEDFLPARLASSQTERYMACVRSRTVLEFEEEVDLGRGARWWRTSLTPFVDPASGRVHRVMGISQDITATKRHEAEMQSFAFSDPLTELPNRRQFDEAVEDALRESTLTGTGFSLVVVDLDDLKTINDVLGHRSGDQAIRFAGRYLRRFVGPREVVARVGGDEFYLMLREATQFDLDRRLDRLRAAVDKGLALPGLDRTIALSVGGVAWSVGDEVHDVLAKADTAMYTEKAIRRLVRIADRMKPASAA